MKKYERLLAWRAAHELAKAVYEATSSFPKSELYGITSQMRRAALSAPTNMVEGAAKRGTGEFRRFLDIAWGSLAELWYQLLFSEEMGYLSTTERGRLERLRGQAAQLTWGLMQKISGNHGKPGTQH
jgi:four helix bundle protein